MAQNKKLSSKKIPVGNLCITPTEIEMFSEILKATDEFVCLPVEKFKKGSVLFVDFDSLSKLHLKYVGDLLK